MEHPTEPSDRASVGTYNGAFNRMSERAFDRASDGALNGASDRAFDGTFDRAFDGTFVGSVREGYLIEPSLGLAPRLGGECEALGVLLEPFL